MNIETVNELIASLESAGELSIKERKYLDVMRWAIRVAGERDAALNAERIWEKTMMEACGEDGPASVASEIRSLRALRDTAIQALKSQVEQLAAENVALKKFCKNAAFDADYEAELDAMTPDERAEYDANIEAFKAMLPQPAPLVPDGYVMVPKDPTEAMMLHNSGCQHHAWDDPDCAMRQTRRLIWSHMLAAAPQSPGSEPATVPGTWIPVSERLPEAGGDMIVFTDGIVMSGVSYAKKKGFYIQALEYDDDEPVDSVTHWMPLPAAPQEVR